MKHILTFITLLLMLSCTKETTTTQADYKLDIDTEHCYIFLPDTNYQILSRVVIDMNKYQDSTYVSIDASSQTLVLILKDSKIVDQITYREGQAEDFLFIRKY